MTEVPLFYYEAARELRERRVDFLTLAMGDEIPEIVGAVLTTEEEREQIDFKDVASTIDEALWLDGGHKSAYESMVLGIDPGPTPGFAVVGDRKVIHSELLRSPEDVLGASKKALDSFTAKSVTFRVGTGGGVYKARTLKILQENLDIPIEVVDEKSTTPAYAGTTSTKDIEAAISIALKGGRILKKKIEVSPTEGEIKNIQRDSRKISGNITISKELAERVAKGEITIDEAILVQRGK